MFSLGVLWGAAPVFAGVDKLGSPRGSLVIVFAACVAANGVVSLAASPHLFVVFVTPVLAATATAYAFSGPSQLRLAIPIGCLLMIVTFTGYNRLAGQHLRAVLVAQHALGEQVAHHRLG